MAKATARQRRTEGRIMHEFKHGELKSGPGGKGGKVKSRKQAIAIALHESGESKYDSASERAEQKEKWEHKEDVGETGQQEAEGKSHVGARGKRESTRAMGGKGATRTTARKTGTRKAPARKAKARASTGARKRKTSRR